MNTQQHEHTENRMNTQQYRKKKTRIESKPKHEHNKTAQTQSNAVIPFQSTVLCHQCNIHTVRHH